MDRLSTGSKKRKKSWYELFTVGGSYLWYASYNMYGIMRITSTACVHAVRVRALRDITQRHAEITDGTLHLQRPFFQTEPFANRFSAPFLYICFRVSTRTDHSSLNLASNRRDYLKLPLANSLHFSKAWTYSDRRVNQWSRIKVLLKNSRVQFYGNNK